MGSSLSPTVRRARCRPGRVCPRSPARTLRLDVLTRTFTHTFNVDDPLTRTWTADRPDLIRVSVDQDGNVNLHATREGWLHLARFAAEMALDEHAPGDHFHFDHGWGTTDAKPEVLAMLVDAVGGGVDVTAHDVRRK